MSVSGPYFEHALLLSGQNGLYRVETREGLLLCRSASGIRKSGYKLLAGDRVTVEDNGDGTGFIRTLEERANSLVRPPVANIGLLVLVVAATDPKPVPFLLDQLTVIAEKQRIPLAIAITKCELGVHGEPEELEEIYRKTPYPVFRISHRGKTGSSSLFAYMKGKTSVFCGASGVGKSTLLNCISPELQAETGALSEKIRRGKNTTRVTTLHRIGEDTYIADTPGFSMLELERYHRLELEELSSLFPEMRPLLGSCRYSHCTHLCEEGCRIVSAVEDGVLSRERHESYCKLYRELKALPPQKRFSVKE